MINVRCLCGKVFVSDDNFPDTHTLIHACPFCTKGWRRSKASGVKWSVYPKLKKLVESYTKLK